MSAKVGQDEIEVMQVLLEAITIHKDVFKVYYYIVIKHIKENLVHQPLEV